MRDEDLQERLRDWFDAIEVPATAIERTQLTVSRVMAQRSGVVAAGTGMRRPSGPGWSWRPRRLIVAFMLAGVLLASGIALAVQMSSAPPTIEVSPEAARALRESGEIGQAPWIHQPNGSPLLQETRKLKSLVFPPGTSYAKAAVALYRSVVSTGQLPAGAKLAPPLPRTVVWRMGSRKVRPALDLTAPFGYHIPDGRILTPTLNIDGSLSPDEVKEILQRLAAGQPLTPEQARHVHVDVPKLARCQIQIPGRKYRPCQLTKPGD